MDQQVPTKDLYELADRYARGDKSFLWVEELLAEKLPDLFPSLSAKRRKVLRQRILTYGVKTFELPREKPVNFDAEQPEPKRKPRPRKWTRDNADIIELSRDYVDGRVMKKIADRLGVDHYSVLVSAYSKEFVARMRSVRQTAQLRVSSVSLAVEWGWKGNAQDHDSAMKFLLSSLESEGLILGPTPSAVAGDD